VEKQNAEQGLMPVVENEADIYGYIGEDRYMVGAFRHRRPIETFEDGVAVAEMLMALYRSAEIGRVVTLPAPESEIGDLCSAGCAAVGLAPSEPGERIRERSVALDDSCMPKNRSRRICAVHSRGISRSGARAGGRLTRDMAYYELSDCKKFDGSSNRQRNFWTNSRHSRGREMIRRRRWRCGQCIGSAANAALARAFALALVVPIACTIGNFALAQDPNVPVNTGPSQQIPRGDLLRPGEAYVTRFSGTTVQPGPNGQPIPVINTGGTVGSIIDIRSPKRPPRGEHWYDEPQRNPVTAGEVGQVFGVVLDDATPPNIYLSATSAFGLHLAPGTQEWMPGLWGQGGGPGTIYRLSRDNGYQPTIFAHITLGGRANTGPALGNMAFDRAHKLLFVSDLETGMIHSIRAGDGADLGFYDHGVIGRAKFFDSENNVSGSLPAIMFDPNSSARIANCAAGPFERSPQCWNFAASGRRVWGVGVRNDVVKNETRLYYSTWSSPTFGNGAAWNAASDDEKRNAVWSIRIGPGGNFDITDIRREFLLPDFFVQTNDIARAGFSQPVSDISFSECSDRPVMLIAERGGIRNLGLSADNPFAYPHEARALRYELDTTGVWRPVGRYDVGYYDRRSDGQPYLRANCAGGIAFAPGYAPNWTMDLAKTDQFVWMTGDYLCSPEGPCHLFGVAPPSAEAGEAAQPASAQIVQDGDDSQVHGAQGLAEGAIDEVMPAGALAPYPTGEGPPYPATGPDQSYLIDTDINIDAAGNLIEAELLRNDATKIGDIAIYEICVPRRQTALLPPPPAADAPPPILVGHDPERSHFLVASHQVRMSHYRFGSHNPYWSHNRFRSHNPYWSHSRLGSHNPYWSHSRWGSHNPRWSHSQWGSHRADMSWYPPRPGATTSRRSAGTSPRRRPAADTRRLRPRAADTSRLRPRAADTRRLRPRAADTRRLRPRVVGRAASTAAVATRRAE